MQRPRSLAEVAREALEAKEEEAELPSGPVQAYFQKLAKSSVFENGIILIILCNCITLAAFDPTDPLGEVQSDTPPRPGSTRFFTASTPRAR